MERSAGLVLFRLEMGRPVFLLLHYAGGHWDFTKGHVEAGESDIEAALREAKEETGISGFGVIDGFREEISYFYKLKGSKVRKSVVFFLGRTDVKDVSVSFEHTGFEWLGYEEALARVTFNSSRDVLKRAAEFIRR